MKLTVEQLEYAISSHYDIAGREPRYRSVATLAYWVSMSHRVPPYVSIEVDGVSDVVRLRSLVGLALLDRIPSPVVDVLAWSRASTNMERAMLSGPRLPLACLYEHQSGHKNRRIIVEWHPAAKILGGTWEPYTGGLVRWASELMMPAVAA